ncbi:MAG TPA: hypothetical protein VGS12_15535 [Caulobacteraceae bacterium]|nr:hypothetical protein [Caulobacteraceae bacterium]
MAAEPGGEGARLGRALALGERLGVIARAALSGTALEVAPARTPLPPLGGFDLVLVDGEAVDPAALAASLSSLGGNGPAVLLAAAHLPSAVIKAAMALAACEVIEPPFGAAELAAAVDRLSRRAPTTAPAAAEPRAGLCWSVTGAVGGCGATTLAVEIAASLARGGQSGRVALVDLNLSGGAAAAYLGVAANMNLADESLDPERIDGSLLDAFAAKAACGVFLLAPPRDPKAFVRVAPATVLRVLDAACQAYGAVVIDLPRRLEPWTPDVLAGADEALVVSELTVPALIAARELADEIEAELQPRRVRIILNRLSTRMFGLAPSMGEAEKALQRKAEAAVTSDWEAAAACANLGGAIGQLRPRSKIVRDVDALAERLLSRRDTPLAGRAAA